MVFISYSRRDKPQALSLAERLRAQGCNVWIDLHGIDAATSWSKEIVNAIDECKAFVLLLSSSSVASHNVVKEVSLASEGRKTILPVDLEQVELTADLRYQLAGLQRVAFENFDAIVKGLQRLGIGSGADPAPTAPVTATDARLSIAVLPFDDLSPSKDNEWFADGLTDELINALSAIDSIRVIDRRTAMGYRGFKGSLQDIALGLNVRYCIEGAVRKQGEQIKITWALYDSRSKEHVHNDSHRGVMEDIFDIQEAVARKAIDALKVKLSVSDEQKITARLTENVEAYEYFMRAGSLIELSTKQEVLRGIELLDEALRCDPDFAAAMGVKASALLVLYRVYEQRPEYLEETSRLITRSILLNPSTYAYHAMATLETIRGNYDEAIRASRKIIELEPRKIRGYMSMGFVNSQTGNIEQAIEWYKKAVEVSPDNVFGYWNLFIQYSKASDINRLQRLVEAALPLYERRLRLQPDDEFLLVALAHFHLEIGNAERAREIVSALIASPKTDGHSLYNIGCLLIRRKEYHDGIDTVAQSIERGFGDVKLIKSDPDLDPVREMPEFIEILGKLTRS